MKVPMDIKKRTHWERQTRWQCDPKGKPGEKHMVVSKEEDRVAPPSKQWRKMEEDKNLGGCVQATGPFQPEQPPGAVCPHASLDGWMASRRMREGFTSRWPHNTTLLPQGMSNMLRLTSAMWNRLRHITQLHLLIAREFLDVSSKVKTEPCSPQSLSLHRRWIKFLLLETIFSFWS